ncbi:uncharacterized protein LOC110974903 [Acanthaster planci]|uniref:Uncharacterized protein LOC110974903 n=1 Tax=Acanthaster planci TaxID=133434 RepID=A0A8B7XRC6_ACAPL|nr:uncharacterized protein LOC110974903 [Acanthaster planci]
MAPSRAVGGCLIFLFVGFIWIPIWIVYSSGSGVAITVLAADVVVETETSTQYLLSAQSEGNDKPTLPEKFSEMLKLTRRENDKGQAATDTTLPTGVVTNQPINAVGIPTTHTQTNHEWSSQISSGDGATISSNQSNAERNKKAGSNDNACNRMADLQKTTLHWIKTLCEALKRQPVIVRVVLLVTVGLSSLLFTVIAYKLLCPRLYRREGIEKLYDIEDSWLLFA